jgi:hypothetical protein
VDVVFIRSSDGCGILPIKFLDELIGHDVGKGFPAVMCFGESFPSDQVLELIAAFSSA